MLRFFRINDPYRLAFIFVLMIIFRLVQNYFMGDISYYGLKWLLLGEWLSQGYTMYTETFDYTGPIAVFVYKFLHLIFGRSEFIHYGISSLIIIFQAGIFNQLLLKNKAYDENSYMPAFLYMILMVSVPDFMTLSPQLLSLTFVLLGLRNVLRRIDNQVTDELFLNTGIFIGIATMIYLPSMVFFLVFLFSLILFSTAVTRRLMLYLFSFLLVFGMCALYFYWRGDLWVFLDSYLARNLLFNASSALTFQTMLLTNVGFIFIFILSVFKTWGSSRLTNFQQKIQQVIWLVFFGGIGTFFLSNEKALHELVFIVPAVAYFWTHYFILLRRRVFKFVMPGLMIFGMLAYTSYSYQSWLQPLEVIQVESIGEKTMVLGSDLSYYKNEQVLTPCFNAELTSRAFRGLDYYSSAGELYDLFHRANPDFIIDEMEVMPKVFSRFPKMGETYQSLGKGRYQKISN
ncbi:MAG: hypothetical protein RLN88_05030 [Ekhidna sp.]|uniref:hypothetical protein n=1 Tax=Ekhidna sp. TaxID=2608089 RepID=UPI0032EC32C1